MIQKLIVLSENTNAVTTADIVLIVVLVLIVIALSAYFVSKKIRGKRITDCSCGSTDSKKLVKDYHKKYGKRKKNKFYPTFNLVRSLDLTFFKWVNVLVAILYE